MNLPLLSIIGILALLFSYYISEYTHFTHTPRLLSRKFLTAKKKINSLQTRLILGTDTLQAFDPFLKFSHYFLSPGEGLLDHGHRGYDTVTYIISGELAYEDFRNNSGTLTEGDVQWLTTGKGIIHSEIAVTDCEVIQFWINLKESYRTTEFSYQNLAREDLVVSKQDGVTVKVIAGESLGRVSYTITRNPSVVIDAELEEDSEWKTDIMAGWNCLVYVIEGTIEIDGDKVKKYEVGTLTQWDTDLRIRCKKKKCRVFLVAGKPLEDILVAFGQFYMPNYPLAEKANRDLKLGTNGFEGALDWKSTHKTAKTT